MLMKDFSKNMGITVFCGRGEKGGGGGGGGSGKCFILKSLL